MIEIPGSKYILAMSADAEPAAVVPQGETVVFDAADCFSDTLTGPDTLFSSVGWDKVDPAVGPVYVEGAEPGDVLKVEILGIELADHGVIATCPGFGAMPDTVEEKTKIVPIIDKDGGKFCVYDWEREDGTAWHMELPVRPMIGVIGVAPLGEPVSVGTPGDHGGNMDVTRIGAGTTLYLPVNVPGALFSTGDVHAMMGDGEVCVCGVETHAKISVRFTVLKGEPMPLPFLAAGDEFMVICSRETLDEAASDATRMMQQFVAERLGLKQTEAAMLLSEMGNLRICQIVDPLRTVRMELPMWLLEECPLP